MNTFKAFIGLSIVTLQIGCAGMTSTMLNRSESDDYSVNKPAGRVHHVTKGVPVTLKVLTHLDVRVTETLYYTDGANGLQPVKLGRRLLDVETNPIRTNKVFTVDFKRPGAGVLDYKADFSDQFFTTFKNKIDDQTLEDINYALGRTSGIIKRFLATKALTVEKLETDVKNKLIVVTRHVAYQRFDVNDPNFETNVDAFISHHLNNCHECRFPPAKVDHP